MFLRRFLFLSDLAGNRPGLVTDVSQIAPKRAQRIKSKPKKSALQRGACNDPYPSEPTIPQPQGEGKGYPERYRDDQAGRECVSLRAFPADCRILDI
jgi:hypothetical protein